MTTGRRCENKEYLHIIMKKFIMLHLKQLRYIFHIMSLVEDTKKKWIWRIFQLKFFIFNSFQKQATIVSKTHRQ